MYTCIYNYFKRDSIPGSKPRRVYMCTVCGPAHYPLKVFLVNGIDCKQDAYKGYAKKIQEAAEERLGPKFFRENISSCKLF